MEINKFNVFRCENCSKILNSDLCRLCGHCLFQDYSKFMYLPHFLENKYYCINHKAIKIEASKEYKEYILKIIKKTNLESFFANLFYIIHEKNMKKIIINEPCDYIYIFDEYLDVSFKILKEKAFILFENINTSETTYTWTNHLTVYSSRFQKYFDSILDCINYDKKLQILLGIVSSENPYFSEKSHLFLQRAVTIAFSIFNDRFLDNINNNKYLNFEFYNDDINKDLVIYLTPIGIINFKNEIKNIDTSDYHRYIVRLLEDINAKYCSSLELSINFESDSFIMHNDTMYCQRMRDNNIYFPESSELELDKLFIKHLLVYKHINYIKL